MAAGVNRQGYIPNRFEEEVLGRLGRITRKDMKCVTPLGSGYPLVYICSPYAGNPAYFTQLARQYCKYAIEQKKQPVASHLLYPQVLDDTDELQREMGLTFGLKLLRLCTEVWVFRPTGGVSPGMKAEIEAAKKAHIPVVYINDPKVYGKPGWDPIKEYDESHRDEESAESSVESSADPPKRKRGRPRKSAVGEEAVTNSAVAEEAVT